MTQQLKTRGEKDPNVEEEEIAHLAGVIDAVGTVTVHITKNDSYSVGYNFEPIVRLIRPKDDNDPILGKVLAYCDENGIKHSISEKSHGPERSSESYEFMIKSPESVRRFLEPMLPHLVTKYEPALVMLEHIVPRMEDDLHLNKEGFYKLMEFADAIRASIRRGTESKYDQQYFAEEWSLAE